MIGETTCEARVSGASETKNLEISSGEFHGVTNRPQKPRQNEKKSLRFCPIFFWRAMAQCCAEIQFRARVAMAHVAVEQLNAACLMNRFEIAERRIDSM